MLRHVYLSQAFHINQGWRGKAARDDYKKDAHTSHAHKSAFFIYLMFSHRCLARIRHSHRFKSRDSSTQTCNWACSSVSGSNVTICSILISFIWHWPSSVCSLSRSWTSLELLLLFPMNRFPSNVPQVTPLPNWFGQNSGGNYKVLTQNLNNSGIFSILKSGYWSL